MLVRWNFVVLIFVLICGVFLFSFVLIRICFVGVVSRIEERFFVLIYYMFFVIWNGFIGLVYVLNSDNGGVGDNGCEGFNVVMVGSVDVENIYIKNNI